MRTTDKIGWLLIGAAIGAGIALLYAPATGKDARRYIRRRAEDARDTLVETGETIRDSIVETGEAIYGAGKDVYKKGAGIATGAAESAAGLWNRGRGMVRS